MALIREVNLVAEFSAHSAAEMKEFQYRIVLGQGWTGAALVNVSPSQLGLKRQRMMSPGTSTS